MQAAKTKEQSAKDFNLGKDFVENNFINFIIHLWKLIYILRTRIDTLFLPFLSLKK